MREILFRGKRTDNGEWAFGFFTESPSGNVYITETVCGGASPKTVDTDTVGQFSGLTDKNGKKIFEGDVLQFNYTGKNHGVEGKATVIFEHGKFGVLWGWHKEIVCLDGFANTTIEVIGNIHDNPELLENP